MAHGSSQQATVDGRNPANQLRLAVYPMIYKVLYIPDGDRRISSINSSKLGYNPIWVPTSKS